MEIEHLQQFSDTLTIVPIRRVAQGVRRWRSVDRNSFRSPRGACDSRSVQHRPPGSTSVRTAIIRYAPRAVGLMEIEKYIRSPARAVGLKPPALQGEARLRGLERNNYSKTIRPRLCKAKPACAERELQRWPSRRSPLAARLRQALGSARRSPPARAM